MCGIKDSRPVKKHMIMCYPTPSTHFQWVRDKITAIYAQLSYTKKI